MALDLDTEVSPLRGARKLWPVVFDPPKVDDPVSDHPRWAGSHSSCSEDAIARLILLRVWGPGLGGDGVVNTAPPPNDSPTASPPPMSAGDACPSSAGGDGSSFGSVVASEACTTDSFAAVGKEVKAALIEASPSLATFADFLVNDGFDTLRGILLLREEDMNRVVSQCFFVPQVQDRWLPVPLPAFC